MNNNSDILIVEDSPTQAEQLRYLLEEHNYHVSVARNGREALASIRQHIPTLVISDIVMPEMDGFDLCKRIRADENIKDIPVILVTALSDPKDIIRALEVGASSFIKKPYDEHSLLSRIYYILANQELRKNAHVQMGVNIFFAGENHFITAERMQILDLLLATYEDAVQENRTLIEMQEELKILNERLEAKVEERTAALTAEIAEHKRAEGALQQSEEQFRLSIENMLDAVGIYSAIRDQSGHIVDFRVEYVNTMACVLNQMSWEEQMGKCLLTLLPGHHESGLFEEYCRVVETGTPLIKESFTYEDMYGEQRLTRIFDIRVGKLRDGFIATWRDVSDHKRLEEQFRQAQKMEAIGRLAGGVAHDFNNLLTIINGYSSFLLDTLEPQDTRRADVKEIKQAGERAAALTRQLLAFSRKQVLEPRILNLNEVITGIDKMLRRLIGEDITLTTIPASDLGLVKVDPGQMEQVLLNLVVNARDAMPQGGHLTIETENRELDASYAAIHLDVTPGYYVMLAVTDTGVGMSPEVQAQIFDPFFTTKERGRGTGLGLSTVYGILKQSGGHISVYSEEGMGTTFKIYLPWVDAGEIVSPQQGEHTRKLGGQETILVVEDDDALRRLAVRTLTGLGYTVIETSGGKEALQRCQQQTEPLHLLLTDVVMPWMGGKELADQVVILKPECKVLYMSGYTDDAVNQHGILAEGTPFLQKPFTPDALARKVREVLDTAEGE